MNFLLLARGASLETARVLAVSAEPVIVGRFLAELAGEDAEEHDIAEGKAGRDLHLVPRGGDG